MRGFVRTRMKIAIVRSNTLLLQCARDKGAYIFQRPGLMYGAVIALLAPWRS